MAGRKQPLTSDEVRGTSRRKLDADSVGLRAGDPAPQTRYGIIDQRGRVRPTSNHGKAEPKPGERGHIIVQKGDTVTNGVLLALGVELPRQR